MRIYCRKPSGLWAPNSTVSERPLDAERAATRTGSSRPNGLVSTPDKSSGASSRTGAERWSIFTAVSRCAATTGSTTPRNCEVQPPSPLRVSATERDLHHLPRLDVQDAIGFELDELALDRLGTDHHHCHKEG